MLIHRPTNEQLHKLPPWPHIREWLAKHGIVWLHCATCDARGHKDDKHCPTCGGRQGMWGEMGG